MRSPSIVRFWGWSIKSIPDIEYRPPIDGDFAFLAERLRELDVKELRAGGRSDVEKALRDCAATPGWVATLVWKGEPAAILGLSRGKSTLAPYGVPWLLGTTSLYTMGRVFWTESKRVLYAMQEEYDVLQNYVWAGSEDSIRWLRKLGFQVDPPNALSFCKFDWRRDAHVQSSDSSRGGDVRNERLRGVSGGQSC